MAVETFSIGAPKETALSEEFHPGALVMISEQRQCCLWAKADLSPADVFKTELLY